MSGWDNWGETWRNQLKIMKEIQPYYKRCQILHYLKQINKKQYRVWNILVGYKDSCNSVSAMELKFLLHYVPIMLLHQQTGLSNLTGMTGNNLHGLTRLCNEIYCTGPVLQMEHCCSKGHPCKRSGISFAPVVGMFSEVPLDSYLGCANHSPTIVEDSCCLPAGLFLICQCIFSDSLGC